MYTTRFPQEAKRMQLKRQVVFESVDAGRIHEQVLELRYVVFAGRGGKRNQRVVLGWGANSQD